MAPGMAYVPAEMPFVSSSPAAEASSPIYHPHHSHNRHDSSSSSASESARRHHHQQQQLPSAHYLDDPASSSPDDGDSHDDDEGEDSDRTESDRGTAPAPLPIQHHQPLPQPQAHSKVQARLQQRQHLAPTDSEETEEEEYPHLQKVPPAPPPPPRGVVKAKSRNSTAGGRSSTTPAPQPRKKVAGKAPQNVPRKKGIAKPIKKRRKVVDEDGDMDDGSVAGDDLGETDANTMDMDNGSKLVSSPNTPPTAITPPINTIPNSYPPNSLPITPPFDPNQPVYCICRKPDSGKWMIGCDGCDDWFHGECIHIPEIDGDLVEQYYCPSCTRLGRGETSWKRKCRLQECRRPAQILGDGDGGKPSKYCSQDHGITFFEKQLLLHNNRSTISKNVLASIVLTTPDVAAFHALGERIPTPPLPADKIHAKYPESAQRLSRIREEISTLNGPVKRLLDARMAYINYAWRRREIVIDARKREAMAAAQARFEICGYDTRLGWDDDVFREWIEGAQTQSSSSQTQAWGEHVCTKRKCGKHQFWQKVRFEEVQLEERLWEEKVSGLREEEGRIWEEVKRWWYRDAEGGREGRVVPEV
ncbi:hypothetical protein DFH27DRAFT_516936 [Peziza echinospora]|nr:hypothetical protein DFH27DRAFT_516936 [Peziza echinospora]